MTTLERLYEKYVVDGYVFISSAIRDEKLLQQAREQVLLNVSKSEGVYKFGKASRHIYQEIANTPVYKLFNNDVVRYFVQKEVPRVNLSEVFMTHEYTNDNGMERNGFLHFDRLWRMKFFYYLSDVLNLESGPLCVVPGTHQRSKGLRTEQLGKEYSKTLNRPEMDFPDYFDAVKDKVIPIYGNAGSLVIFNTDTLHRGGIVSGGQERIVCRLHVS